MDLLQKEPALYERALKTEMIVVKIGVIAGEANADIPYERNVGDDGILLKNVESENEVLFVLKQDGTAIVNSVVGDDLEILDLALADGDKLILIMLAE